MTMAQDGFTHVSREENPRTDSRENVELQDEMKRSQERRSPFEQLLDDYEYKLPRRGQILEGEIMYVDDDQVLVDVGAKRDAIVPRRDLDRLDREAREGLEEGDRMPVYVIRSPRVGGDLLVSISKGMESEDWEHAKALETSGDTVELEVIGRNRGGLEVAFGRLRGFVPNSHLPRAGGRKGRGSKPDSSGFEIGSLLLLQALEVDQRRHRLVFSARSAEKRRRHARLRELAEGQIHRGRVVNIVDFGAFVDLGGVDGLVHISKLAWQRVDHPSEVVSIGDEVYVKVDDVDVERERVSLNMKVMAPSPWETADQRYRVGDLVEGTVTNIVSFGAFVSLPDGLEGLIHVSEMEIIGPGTSEDVLRTGEEVVVKIVRLEPEKERIGLSLKRVTYEDQVRWMMGKRSQSTEDEG